MHHKPILTKITASIVIVLTLLAVISASVLAVTIQAVTPKEKADTLIILFKKANNKVNETFNSLKEKNIEIPQACVNTFKTAEVLSDEAASFYKIGNYSEASNKTIQALSKLKETLMIIYENTNLPQSEFNNTLERIALLNSSINRYADQLTKLESLLSVAATSGFDTSLLEADLVAVRIILNNASKSMEQKDWEAVTSYVAEAKKIVEHATQAFNDWAVYLKTLRLESYINQTETRLTSIRQEATSVSNTASLAALNKAETSLSLARDYLAKQLLNQTVAALVNSKESEVQAVKALTPVATTDATSITGSTTTASNTTSPSNISLSAPKQP